MNALERFAIKKLRAFFADAANNGITIDNRKVDDDVTVLILGIIEDYIAEKEEEDDE
jgi:hypothetical protein